jgi:putative endonuclease
MRLYVARTTWHSHKVIGTIKKIRYIRIESLKTLKFYFVYLLESQRDFSFYIGFTENVKLRLDDHNKGYVVSTRLKLPWKLIYFEAYLDKKDALGREKFLKSGSGQKLLLRQLRDYLS